VNIGVLGVILSNFYTKKQGKRYILFVLELKNVEVLFNFVIKMDNMEDSEFEVQGIPFDAGKERATGMYAMTSLAAMTALGALLGLNWRCIQVLLGAFVYDRVIGSDDIMAFIGGSPADKFKLSFVMPLVGRGLLVHTHVYKKGFAEIGDRYIISAEGRLVMACYMSAVLDISERSIGVNLREMFRNLPEVMDREVQKFGVVIDMHGRVKIKY
jgi:hypothetical protein